jgi:S-methylmethionine-dependent homocysteine/selenocysteine methylase
MASSSQTILAARAASAAGTPVLVSFTLDDSQPARLRGGETLGAALEAVAHEARVSGFLVNCCSPSCASAALPVLREASLRLCGSRAMYGCLPNAFLQTTSDWLAERDGRSEADGTPPSVMSPQGFADWGAAAALQEHTADAAPRLVLGGCCGTSPAHIHALSLRLRPPTAL